LGTCQDDGTIRITHTKNFATEGEPNEVLRHLEQSLAQLLEDSDAKALGAIGISCGGPLDSKRGLILSPPNLPLWDNVDVVTPLKRRFGVAVGLQNDANACALAEWQWGAGKGCQNIVFLTFGTGMGAGLILNGQLYAGTNDLAGEVGHVRLRDAGPMGYGKQGSFEGFCSGGGIARLAQERVAKHLAQGQTTLICTDLAALESITAQTVGVAAQKGDPLALEIYRIVGDALGQGLSMLVDLLNPERIIIGSIYLRQQSLLEPIVLGKLQEEALPQALAVCDIVPAGLGESAGDYAGLSVALWTWRKREGQLTFPI
ncbi:MAG TPA: ROK family protein, partial [Limnochordia bacterium]|nr:ROK family protein [Limnochordia bacterium]